MIHVLGCNVHVYYTCKGEESMYDACAWVRIYVTHCDSVAGVRIYVTSIVW